MYLNEEYQDDSINTAIEANEQAMDIVYDAVIKPMEGNLDEEQAYAVAIAGATLRIIAEKAYAYEKMQKGQDLRN